MFENLTVAEIIAGITALGIIAGFFGKLFAQLYKIKTNAEDIIKLQHRVDRIETSRKDEKQELIKKVDSTNEAVNLLCNAISALIDNEISNGNNLDELKTIKKRLDDKKEIV